MQQKPFSFDLWYKKVHDRKALSGKSGVYAIFHKFSRGEKPNSYNRCIYIGASKDMHNRIHLKIASKTPINQNYYFNLAWPVIRQHGLVLIAVKFVPIAELNSTERAFIEHYKPMFNCEVSKFYCAKSGTPSFVPKTDTQNSY